MNGEKGVAGGDPETWPPKVRREQGGTNVNLQPEERGGGTYAWPVDETNSDNNEENGDDEIYNRNR
jgi:hypothetical protein